jgi:hypothetical protein
VKVPRRHRFLLLPSESHRQKLRLDRILSRLEQRKQLLQTKNHFILAHVRLD